MGSEAAKLNAEALEILSQGNFIGAQRKFQINAKKHPGHQTFNNLGQYYFTEGLEMKNGKVRNADTLGIYQLKKAEKLQQTPLNLTNLGVAYYERAKYITYSPSDYEAALEYFTRANELKTASWRLYNMAACLWRLERYEEASAVLKRLCSDYPKEKIRRECATGAMAPYAFSLLKTHRSEQWGQLLKTKIQCSEKDMEIYDRFTLFYLGGKLEQATVLCTQIMNEILKEWQPNLSVLAMLIDCAIQHSLFENWQMLMKYLSENSRENNRILRKLVKDEQFRMKTIQSFHYEMGMTYPCGYFGCPKHRVPRFTQK